MQTLIKTLIVTLALVASLSGMSALAQEDGQKIVTFSDGEQFFLVTQLDVTELQESTTMTVDAALVVSENVFIESFFEGFGVTQFEEVDIEDDEFIEGSELTRAFVVMLEDEVKPIIMIFTSADQYIYVGVALLSEPEDVALADELFIYLEDSIENEELGEVPEGFDEIERTDENGTPTDDDDDDDKMDSDFL